MQKNKYFVSYSWKTFWRHGFGMCTLDTTKNMETEDGLLDAHDAIREKNRFSSVVIMNFIKLGETDV